MTALIDACAAALPERSATSTATNVASIKLHESFGFRQVGYLPGWSGTSWLLDGLDHDVQRLLGPGATRTADGISGLPACVRVAETLHLGCSMKRHIRIALVAPVLLLVHPALAFEPAGAA